ncbi:MAG: hypothetical protein WBA10_03510 [Elainellaceae cyanobacterium]
MPNSPTRSPLVCRVFPDFVAQSPEDQDWRSRLHHLRLWTSQSNL